MSMTEHNKDAAKAVTGRSVAVASTVHHPVRVSFEFFPPKTEKMAASLWDAVKRLEPLHPSFVSVTYGAGGTTRERTHETVVRIARETTMKPAAHLTCVAATRDEIDAIAKDYWDAGINHIVALRGDPPDDVSEYVPHADGYAYASDLVAGLKAKQDYEISVAAYPEGHPQSPTLAADIDNLKRKIDAGATRAITQYFFDVDVFRRFRDVISAAGITIPVIPGILPVTNFSQVVKFSKACGTSVPDWMHRVFDGLDDDPETRKLVASTLAYEQVQALSEDGIEDFHFYTLNRADLTFAICHLLGVRPQTGN